MNKIINIKGREILDSRGNPTVEVEVTIENNIKGIASVPSGASTGKNEALELRDGDPNRYLGKGVLKAVYNINNIIKPKLIGMDINNQKLLDETMITLDGTPNKSNLGANAILGISIACLKASAKLNNKELYEIIGTGNLLPNPMMNIINGGAHADNNLDVQEFMIIPVSNTFKERLRMGSEIFHNLKKILHNANFNTGVGDEGGFAPNLKNTEEALDYIIKAIKISNYIPGKDVNIGLDVAASELFDNGIYNIEGKKYNREELVDYYVKLVDKYPIISIEDGMAEEDFEGWKILTKKLNNIQLVGDDLFVTNPKIFKKGIDINIANAILIKLNQIGTITETLETIKLAKENNYNIIISHRSGETEDNYIADFAVGLNLGQIKTGSLSRSERISKYNRLLKIEEIIKQ